MSTPIEVAYSSGKTLYFVIHNPDGTVWNKDTADWEAYDSANWVHYANELTEQSGSGYYRASYPITDPLDILPTEVVYQQAGPTPDLPSDLPPISVGQSQGSNLFAINGAAPPAANLSLSAGVIVPGKIIAGTISDLHAPTNLPSPVNGAYVGRVVIFTSGNLLAISAIVTGYNGSTKDLAFTQLPASPSVDDEFVIV